MNIKRNIIFSLESRKKNGVPIVENVPIRMRVIFASQRIEFTTGYRIDAAKWDADKQRVKPGCTNKLKQSASEINTDLLRYYTEIQNIFKEKFAAVRKHLEKFDKELTFEALDEPKLTSYVNFLKDVEGLRNTSTMKQIAYLKWFLRWCTKKGYCMNNAYESFNPKLKSVQKKVIFLTWEELNKLKDYKIPLTKQYLERVRDVFLFCCFSGLRYSDVYNLKRSDIRDGYIEITTVKTADRLVIELNNHSRAILDKYKDVEFEGHKALPVISNQKMNNYLKELGELAEINEPVSETYYKGSERIDTVTPKYALLGTHAGRRTFICNALALGIPAQVVMKWTGHSDYKAMKPYIDIADDVKANAMSKFNQL